MEQQSATGQAAADGDVDQQSTMGQAASMKQQSAMEQTTRGVYDHDVEGGFFWSLFDHDLAESVIFDCPIDEN
jgi:hypothetical protein